MLIKKLIMRWILAQLATANSSIDWAAIKAEVEAKVAAALPYTLLDEPLDMLVDEVIAALQGALTDEADITTILDDCMSSNWTQAEADLVAMLEKIVNPTPAQQALLAGIKA